MSVGIPLSNPAKAKPKIPTLQGYSETELINKNSCVLDDHPEASKPTTP